MTADLWLEISDAGEPSTGDELRISWRWQLRSQAGSAELSFASPLTKNTRGLLDSYVREFRSWRPHDRDRGLTAERSMLNLGRALGSALVETHRSSIAHHGRTSP